MNKDVIYIEPDDDITDIITKIENAKEKIVALVPPKKAGVFRSIVNIKLIAKTSATADKTVVLVTTDPSIIKLAAATRLAVTKNLQTPPQIPEMEIETDEASKEDLIEEEVEEAAEAEAVAETEAEAEAATKEGEALAEAEKEEAEAKTDEDSDEDNGKDKKDDKNTKKEGKKGDKSADGKKNGKKFSLAWFKEHKAITIGCGVGLVALIIFIIWGFVIAPAATISVSIRTKANNLFSENVSFTTNSADENAENGKFYIQEKKMENKLEKEIEATGEKNLGEKAKGNVIIYRYFKEKGAAVAVNSGSRFEVKGLVFTSDQDASLSYNDASQCENKNDPESLIAQGCLISKTVPVTAIEAGSKYNIGPATTDEWDTAANVFAWSNNAMTGGTDKIITVVQQSDIDKARNELLQRDTASSKEKLVEKIEGEHSFPIDSSFEEKVGDIVSTPAIGEEVEAGKKATISVTITDSIFVIDEAKVREFITKKAQISDTNQVYDIKNLFIENFDNTDGNYTGRLKATYTTGPKITESEIVDIVKGKGFGVAQHDLKSIDGLGSVTIDGNLPWVTSFPNNPEKITVHINSENKNEDS